MGKGLAELSYLLSIRVPTETGNLKKRKWSQNLKKLDLID